MLVATAAAAAAAAAALLYLRRRAATHADIDALLAFWFDGDHQTLIAERWFAPSGSAAQAAMDAEAKSRFGALLRRGAAGELAHWRRTPRGALALILLLDQISRHVHRADDRSTLTHDAMALALSEELLARGWTVHLRGAELVFALMPLRHAPTEARLRRVLDEVEPRLASCDGDAAVLRRFERATKLRLLHLAGDGDPEDVLERPDLEHELSQDGALDSPLARSVADFLSRQIGFEPAAGVLPPPARGNGRGKRAAPTPAAATAGVLAAPLLVSLSGGVDSMVLCHLLIKLTRGATLETGEAPVHAVHIDYANRAESGAEADFLKRWCEARGVPLTVRVVSELSRATGPRDEYERESRRIRFDSYKRAMADGGARAVLFGHHRGDVQENVVSNVMKGAAILDVAGISEASASNGVMVWRPMLTHPKDHIYEYAHAFGVPYFKDTTPRWSTRGKLRNQLLPLLAEVYGEGFREHLCSLARSSAQCAALLDNQLLGPFAAAVRPAPLGVRVDVRPFADLPPFFWREALRRLCEGTLGCGLVKEGAISILLERLQRPPEKQDGWLQLRGPRRCALLDGGTLTMFRDVVFPGGHEGRTFVPAAHAAEGTAIPGTSATVALGPWRVRVVPAAQEAPAELTLERLLSGRFVCRTAACEGYAIAGTSRAHADALRPLERRFAGIVLGVPQVVGVGDRLGGDVDVEYEWAGT